MFNRASSILEIGRRASEAMESAKRLRDTVDFWQDDSPAKELNEEFNHYQASEQADPSVLQRVASKCRAHLAEGGSGFTPDDNGPVGRFCSLIEDHVTAREAFQRALSVIDADVASFRRSVWGGNVNRRMASSSPYVKACGSGS